MNTLRIKDILQGLNIAVLAIPLEETFQGSKAGYLNLLFFI